MELKLLNEGDPLLQRVAEPYDFSVDGDPTELVRAMTKVMFENNGIGLAAPQVGINKRLFLMGNSDKLYVCINPHLVKGDGDERDLEGCLSFPNLYLRVLRKKSIIVKYQTITGEHVEQIFEGLIARVFQHELDHLNGICFDTRVGPTALDMAKEKRRRKSR